MMIQVLKFQGFYYFLTGFWPILHIESFFAVTGPKEEIWMVKMVGAVTAVIGLTLLAAATRKKIEFEIFILSFFSALAYFTIDLFYGLLGPLPAVYTVDGMFELVIAGTLLIAFPEENKTHGYFNKDHWSL